MKNGTGKEIAKSETQLTAGSPDDLISKALNSGADLDKLEKLLILKERYDAGEARKAYHVAMAAFKASPPSIDKDKKVAYGTTKYSHASLANVVEKITAELSKHGLSASWRTQQNGQIVVTCRISHVLGHFEETSLQAASDTTGSKNAIQAMGSTISYLERYSLLAILGLATHDQDDDGKATSRKSESVAMPKKKEDLIDEKQYLTIITYINGCGIDEAAFLKYMKVAAIEEIPKSEYQNAIDALEKKVKRSKKGRPPTKPTNPIETDPTEIDPIENEVGEPGSDG